MTKVSTASVGRFQECFPKEKTPQDSGKKWKFLSLFEDFATEKKTSWSYYYMSRTAGSLSWI